MREGGRGERELCLHYLYTAVGNKAKKLVDGRATLPKKIMEIEVLCKVSKQRIQATPPDTCFLSASLAVHVSMKRSKSIT